MRLYYSPFSPYVRKVMVVLHEAELADQVELVTVVGTALEPGNQPLAQNPLGKIPTLEREGGPALYDSRVICRYLDDRAGTGLYPGGARQWDVLTLEATADGIMDSAVLMTYERKLRPPELVFENYIDAQWTKVARALDVVEARWLSHLAGPLDIAQIGIACVLGYIDLRHDERQWRKGRDGLASWYAGFAGRPSMLATAPQA